ncbi:MAG: DnaB-like helicase N-terminal domain-containing protein [Alphaproteobacteria bacterium]
MEKPDITTLPQNLEAEQALLEAILANNKAFEKVSEFLKPQHFADPVHAKIFEVMSKLITRGHIADVITLKNYFEQEGSLKRSRRRQISGQTGRQRHTADQCRILCAIYL